MTAFAPAQLDQHTGALRRLARTLVRDAHTADDLVQETWLRVLQSPPPRAGDIGAWLRTVLRSLAGRARRAAARRSQREAAVAREEGAPEPQALAERQRSVAALIRAVGALPHAQQTCVWLRYFDGLPPRAIAARLGVPVPTVHSRLQRAHATLRTILSHDGRDRRWALALSGAFGLRLRSAPMSVGIGAAIMTMNKKLLLGLAAGVVFGLVGLRLATPSVSAVSAIEVPAPALLSMPGPSLAAVAGERAPLPEVAPDAAVTPQPFDFTLEVLALDEHDLPAARLPVLIDVPGHPMNSAGRTDGRGRLRLQWQGRQPVMDVVVGDDAGQRCQRLNLTAGEARTVLLRRQRVTLLRDDSMVLRGGLHATGTREIPLAPGYVSLRTPRLHDSVPTMDVLHGDLRRFVTPAFLTVRGGDIIDTFDAATEYALGLKLTGLDAVSSTVQGVVRDAVGRPLAECCIAQFASEAGAVLQTTTTDAEGRYRLPVTTGAVLLRAGGGRHGIAWLRGTVAEQEHVAWDPQLDRGYELMGRLRGEDGEPLPGWRIDAALEHATEPFLKSATTDAQGRFAIPNVPLASCALRAFHPDCGAIGVHDFLPQMPGSGELDLRAPTSAVALGPLALVARTRAQAAVAGAEFVVLSPRDGRGVRLRGDGDGVAPTLAVPAGTYAVDAVAPGRQTRTTVAVLPAAGSVLAETIWLDDTVVLRLRVPSAHEIVLSQIANDVVLRVSGVEDHPSMTAEGEGVHEHEWALAPGEYVIESPTGRRRVLLRAGEPQTLDLTGSSKAPR